MHIEIYCYYRYILQVVQDLQLNANIIQYMHILAIRFLPEGACLVHTSLPL